MHEVYLENTSINHKTGKRHHKFYQMRQMNNGLFEATWGRIGAVNPQSKSYSMSDWHTILDQKLSKGYEIIADSPSSNIDDIREKAMNDPRFIKIMNGIDDLRLLIEDSLLFSKSIRKNDLEFINKVKDNIASELKASPELLDQLNQLHKAYYK